MKRADGRRWIGIIAGLLGASLWAATLALPHLSGHATLVEGFEATLVDLRYSFFGPKPASDAVLLKSGLHGHHHVKARVELLKGSLQ